MEKDTTNQSVKTPQQIITDRINAIQSKIWTYRNKLNKLGAQGQFYQFMYSQVISLNCAKLEELRLLQTKLKT